MPGSPDGPVGDVVNPPPPAPPVDPKEWQKKVVEYNEALQKPDSTATDLETVKTGLLETLKKTQDTPIDGNDPLVQAHYQALLQMLARVNINVRDPTVFEDIRAAHLRNMGKDDKGVISKITSRIPKFDGKSESFTWSHFLSCFTIAVGNANYKDYELRAILLNCLDGNALEHYRAHEEEYILLDYNELIKRFTDRYGELARTSIHDLVGIHQAAKEDVLSFRDRMLVVAKPLLPDPPPRQRIVVQDGASIISPNLNYVQEYEMYKQSKKQHDMYFVRFFVNGLREEILGRLSTTEYDALESAVAAARIAEDYLKAVSQIKTNHVKIHAVSGSKSVLQSMEDKNKAVFNSKKSGKCHICGIEGHWKNECPSKGRSTSRGRSNSSSKRNPKRDSSGPEWSKNLIKRFDTIDNRINSLEKRTRGRSKSGGRNSDQRSGHRNSRSRSGSRPRYRKSSRGRSSSHGRSSGGSRYNSRSRSGSKSRSNSKNGNRYGSGGSQW